MKPAPAIATVPDNFDPLNVATPAIGHNQSPFDILKQELEDLFEEAKNFCDGEPIDSQALADAITELHDKIHDCGNRAEKLRVEEKRPLDEQVAAIQTKFHGLIGNTKAGKGKVILGKEACQSLLTPWRTKVAADKATEAARVAASAAEATRIAQEAIRASSGNLAAREEAEELLADSKKLEKTAARSFKAATTGTGLRTIWVATPLAEAGAEEKRLDWAYGRSPERFAELVQQLADEQVRAGVRTIPGFVVKDEKRAM